MLTGVELGLSDFSQHLVGTGRVIATDERVIQRDALSAGLRPCSLLIWILILLSLIIAD